MCFVCKLIVLENGGKINKRSLNVWLKNEAIMSKREAFVVRKEAVSVNETWHFVQFYRAIVLCRLYALYLHWLRGAVGL